MSQTFCVHEPLIDIGPELSNAPVISIADKSHLFTKSDDYYLGTHAMTVMLADAVAHRTAIQLNQDKLHKTCDILATLQYATIQHTLNIIHYKNSELQM